MKNDIYIPKKVVSLHIYYTLNLQLRNWNTDFTFSNCLFSSVKLTKNTDQDKYKHRGYGIGFGSCSEFLFTDGSFGKNVIILGADMSPSVHIENKGKDILIIDEEPTQGSNDTTLVAEAKYPINSTKPNKRFILSVHYIN